MQNTEFPIKELVVMFIAACSFLFTGFLMEWPLR